MATRKTIHINNKSIELIQGDITSSETVAIVNPANSSLQLGGGVAGAIRKRGGPQIQEECDKIGWVPVGQAVMTSAGNLKTRYVIHAVGPRMGEGNEDIKLKNATINSLKLADQNHIRSISFPAISTGIFGYPKDRCANIMLSTTIEYLKGDSLIERVIFYLYDHDTYEIFHQILNDISTI